MTNDRNPSVRAIASFTQVTGDYTTDTNLNNVFNQITRARFYDLLSWAARECQSWATRTVLHREQHLDCFRLKWATAVIGLQLLLSLRWRIGFILSMSWGMQPQS